MKYKDLGRLTEAIPLLEEAYRASKQEPSIAWVGSQRIHAYIKGADPAMPESVARATTLVRDLVADARAKLPENSPELAGQLATRGLTLLMLNAWDEAEPLIREWLAIREKAIPDDWLTFNAKSMLGGALLGMEGQNKLAEAVPLLLDGYQGMKDREAAIPPQARVRVPEALERLVNLYEAWDKVEPGKGYDAKAASWREKMPQQSTSDGGGAGE